MKEKIAGNLTSFLCLWWVQHTSYLLQHHCVSHLVIDYYCFTVGCQPSKPASIQCVLESRLFEYHGRQTFCNSLLRTGSSCFSLSQFETYFVDVAFQLSNKMSFSKNVCPLCWPKSPADRHWFWRFDFVTRRPLLGCYFLSVQYIICRELVDLEIVSRYWFCFQDA